MYKKQNAASFVCGMMIKVADQNHARAIKILLYSEGKWRKILLIFRSKLSYVLIKINFVHLDRIVVALLLQGKVSIEREIFY